MKTSSSDHFSIHVQSVDPPFVSQPDKRISPTLLSPCYLLLCFFLSSFVDNTIPPCLMPNKNAHTKKE